MRLEFDDIVDHETVRALDTPEDALLEFVVGIRREGGRQRRQHFEEAFAGVFAFQLIVNGVDATRNQPFGSVQHGFNEHSTHHTAVDKAAQVRPQIVEGALCRIDFHATVRVALPVQHKHNTVQRKSAHQVASSPHLCITQHACQMLYSFVFKSILKFISIKYPHIEMHLNRS